MTDREKARRYDELVGMMRRQRDQFRDPDHGLGRAHMHTTRVILASLLDWYLYSYTDEHQQKGA